MSKVIQTDVGFAFQRSVIGPNNSHHSLNQSDAKQEPITTWSPAFFLRFQINKLIKLFLGIKSSYMRLFLIRSPYLVFFKCLEPSKRKKIHFFIRIRPSFREKPRKNK